MDSRKIDSVITRLDEGGLCIIKPNMNVSSRRRSSDSLESSRSRLRQTLSKAARKSRSCPDTSTITKRSSVKYSSRHSTSSLGPRNKHTCRLRSAESLCSLRSRRGRSLSSRHELHHTSTDPHQIPSSGGPNAEFEHIPCHEWCALRSQTTSTAVQRALKKEVAEKFARINIRYKNERGRTSTIASCTVVHHDSGRENKILNVTLLFRELEKLERSDDIEWVDRKGAIYFVQNV